MSKSNKRRRCINVDGGYVDLLKEKSANLEKISHTKLATLILIGAHPPIGTPRSRKKSQGVSMTEALWLAVKMRDRSSEESTVGVAEKILEGTMPHLTPEEIQHGKDRAAKREAKRAESDPEEKTVPKSDSTKRKKKRAKKKNIEEKSAKKEEKINGKNIDQTSMVIAERKQEEEERKKQRMKLHKGQVYEQESSRPPDKLEPGEEFYGGVKYI